jgi:hypothetical protein
MAGFRKNLSGELKVHRRLPTAIGPDCLGTRDSARREGAEDVGPRCGFGFGEVSLGLASCPRRSGLQALAVSWIGISDLCVRYRASGPLRIYDHMQDPVAAIDGNGMYLLPSIFTCTLNELLHVDASGVP